MGADRASSSLSSSTVGLRVGNAAAISLHYIEREREREWVQDHGDTLTHSSARAACCAVTFWSARWVGSA